ncbi:ABC transporter ATP-binding protein [Aurantimonas endophytica]|uniref:Phospholipid/cholesterol/gamma-HCH transport system ATP-binding protein n=1 Tax=Aurantimonas endophytica TaxID=1522175 RepID=A0A7W6HB52_9HYPH|nr:ABC transporter ATP-binding protein [Aurantimonas endophytica]MBB4001831.1 phospholipid/cholesterol/gamma-HCH transport system ATP-binding protein [Aurantimonas endophytica]MCO6402532.1 ATP-binding cassette domain-containing protein [Aurantimonas endophytica]
MPPSVSDPARPNGAAAASRNDDDIIIRVEDVTVRFGENTILDKLSLEVRRGEILGFVGPSGSGKSVLLRTILGLNQKQGGTIDVFGINYPDANDEDRLAVERRWGVLFQHGALFSSLTVLENIEVPMREYLDLSPELMHELARLKLDLVGLPQDAAGKFPSELSGGMIKRAALARALALDPDIVFLDEPTSGLDPIGAADFDQLIMTLRDTLGLSVYMVTHDLDSLFQACDRIAVLGDRKVLVEGPLSTMLAFDHPWVKSYFHGKRARTIAAPENAGHALEGIV